MQTDAGVIDPECMNWNDQKMRFFKFWRGGFWNPGVAFDKLLVSDIARNS